MIHFFGTGPQKRLSSLAPRLSPIIKKYPGGILIGRGKLHVPGAQGREKLSPWGLPLTIAWPFRIASVSPGIATIRLMKFVPARWGTGRGQASSSGLLGPPQVLLSAPAGGWTTAISPRSGSLNL